MQLEFLYVFCDVTLIVLWKCQNQLRDFGEFGRWIPHVGRSFLLHWVSFRECKLFLITSSGANRCWTGQLLMVMRGHELFGWPAIPDPKWRAKGRNKRAIWMLKSDTILWISGSRKTSLGKASVALVLWQAVDATKPLNITCKIRSGSPGTKGFGGFLYVNCKCCDKPILGEIYI